MMYINLTPHIIYTVKIVRMEIFGFKIYMDGGTVEVSTDGGNYCFDRRVSSDNRDVLYRGYPRDDGSNMVENQSGVTEDIMWGLKSYNDKFYRVQIENFINSKIR